MCFVVVVQPHASYGKDYWSHKASCASVFIIVIGQYSIYGYISSYNSYIQRLAN